MINNSIKNHQFIVFGAEHFNTLGIIRSLGEEGIVPEVVIIKSKQRIATASRYCGRISRVESIEDGYNFIIEHFSVDHEGNKPFILTSDDLTTSFLDQKYNDIKDRFVFFNAGAQGAITETMEKKRMCDIAEKHGLNVPRTVVARVGDIPNGLDYPVITKADDSLSSNWKGATHVCWDEAQLSQAFLEIKQEKVLLQNYIIKKNELCLDGYSWNCGKNVFIGIASYYKYQLPDRYSYYMDVFNFHDDELQTILESIFTEIGFEGIFTVEFLVDENDNLHFLEINFRNSTWSYASTKAGMNLVTGWCTAMIEGDKHIPIYKKVPDGFTDMVEISDFKTRVIGKRIGLINWLQDFKSCNCTFYYDKHDKKPFVMAILTKFLH